MTIEGGITILIAIAFIFIMKEKPKHPPSKVAESAALDIHLGMWKDVTLLLKNKNFICLMFTYSIVYSIVNSMMDAISPLFHPYYDRESFISAIAIVQIVTTMITELLTGPWLDRKKRYLCTLRSTVFATCFVTFCLIFIIPSSNYILCSISIAVVGLTVGPILPVGFDFSIQLTHPMPPSLVNGMLQMSEQIFEFLLSTTLVALCTKNPQWALICIFAICCVAAVISLFIEEDLRVERLEQEKKELEF